MMHMRPLQVKSVSLVYAENCILINKKKVKAIGQFGRHIPFR